MGDQVTAYDPATGKASVQTVQQTYINHDTNLLAVTLRTMSPASASQGTTTGATKQQDAAIAAHGAQAPPATTAAPTRHDETIQTTTNHPWLTVDHGWILASFLHVGEPVQRVDGSMAIVVLVRAEPGTAAMWDLTVSQEHTFAVGSGVYVVHNCGETIDPSEVRYTQDSISRMHGDGHSVLENIEKLKSGELSPDDMDPIRIFKKTADIDAPNLEDGKLYSLDNRRLYEFREAGIKEIPYQWADPDDIARLQARGRFSTQNFGTSIQLRGIG